MTQTRRSGLGKGLSSLIPADVESDGSTFREIDIDGSGTVDLNELLLFSHGKALR